MPAEGSGGHGLRASLRSAGEEKMSASPRNTPVDEARLTAISTGPLPASRKVHVSGSLHSAIRVPMRQIAQTSTRAHVASPGAAPAEVPNPPVLVYTTPGPHTHPQPPLSPPNP